MEEGQPLPVVQRTYEEAVGALVQAIYDSYDLDAFKEIVESGMRGVRQMTNKELVAEWATHFGQTLELDKPFANPNGRGDDDDADALKFTISFNWRDLPDAATEALGGQAGAEAWLKRNFRYVKERLVEHANESCFTTLLIEDHIPVDDE